MESLELRKNGSSFIHGEMPKKMEDPELFTLPSQHRTIRGTDYVFGLADETKSYPIGIFIDVEVHIARLKLLTDFYVIDMKRDPETPLLVGRGFLATANTVIDCRKAKIVVGEGITRSVFGVKGIDLGQEEAPYWTTIGKRESYKPRPSLDDVGARTPYYARKDFLDCYLPREWEIARDAEINPFKDSPINYDKPPKNKDGAWHASIRLIHPDEKEFTETLQSVYAPRKLSEREDPREIIDLDRFNNTKARLLEDKQIPSVGVFDEVSFYTLFRERGDGIADFKRRRQDVYGDGVMDLTTASGRSRLKTALEDST
nr:hypothetical protein [Tanacetum cinerariifolium]